MVHLLQGDAMSGGLGSDNPHDLRQAGGNTAKRAVSAIYSSSHRDQPGALAQGTYPGMLFYCSW